MLGVRNRQPSGQSVLRRVRRGPGARLSPVPLRGASGMVALHQVRGEAVLTSVGIYWLRMTPRITRRELLGMLAAIAAREAWAADPPLRFTALDHVEFLVSDVEKSAAFYARVFAAPDPGWREYGGG